MGNKIHTGRRAQVSVFMIVAITAVILLAAIMYLTQPGPAKKTTAAEMMPAATTRDAVQQFITGCLRETTEDALRIAGERGGYIYPEKTLPGYTDYQGEPVHYLYLYGRNMIPSREEVEALQISRYISDRLEECTGDFQGFGARVSAGEPDTTTTINDNNVLVMLKMPVTITTDRSTETMDDFTASVPVRLGHLMDIAGVLIDSAVLNPNWVDLDYLGEIDAKVELYVSGEDETVYKVIDPQSRLGGEPYSFQFAMLRFRNSAPEMLPIPDLKVKVGETVKREIAAVDFDDEELTFSLDSKIGTIDPKRGIITITPRSGQEGLYLAVAHARDSFGLESVQPFFVEVTR